MGGGHNETDYFLVFLDRTGGFYEKINLKLFGFRRRIVCLPFWIRFVRH